MMSYSVQCFTFSSRLHGNLKGSLTSKDRLTVNMSFVHAVSSQQSRAIVFQMIQQPIRLSHEPLISWQPRVAHIDKTQSK